MGNEFSDGWEREGEEGRSVQKSGGSGVCFYVDGAWFFVGAHARKRGVFSGRR